MTAPTMMRCDAHGETRYVLLCRHLLASKGVGYVYVNARVGAPGQAWCEECDVVVEAERGWTDRANAAAEWKLVCTTCARSIRRGHRCLGRIVGTDE